ETWHNFAPRLEVRAILEYVHAQLLFRVSPWPKLFVGPGWIAFFSICNDFFTRLGFQTCDPFLEGKCFIPAQSGCSLLCEIMPGRVLKRDGSHEVWMRGCD